MTAVVQEAAQQREQQHSPQAMEPAGSSEKPQNKHIRCVVSSSGRCSLGVGANRPVETRLNQKLGRIRNAQRAAENPYAGAGMASLIYDSA